MRMSDEQWREVLSTDLDGAFYCARATMASMVRARQGSIIFIGSISPFIGVPGQANYAAAKAGLVGLARAIAKEVATEGICVNAVSPAVIRTKILDQLTPAQVDYMVQRIPMKRTGQPEEVAAVVHFLASRDCSFVTGQCYDVSGGRATY